MNTKTIIGGSITVIFAIWAFLHLTDQNTQNQRVMSAKLDAQTASFDADFKKAWDGDRADPAELAKLQHRADKLQHRADKLQAKTDEVAEVEDAKVKALRDQSYAALKQQLSNQLGE